MPNTVLNVIDAPAAMDPPCVRYEYPPMVPAGEVTVTPAVKPPNTRLNGPVIVLPVLLVIVSVPDETPARLVASPDALTVNCAVISGLTLTLSVFEALLPAFDSLQLHATDAALLSVAGAAAATATTILIVAFPATAIGVVLVHVTCCATAEQVNPPPDPLTNVMLASSVSETVIVPDAAAAPALFTTSV